MVLVILSLCELSRWGVSGTLDPPMVREGGTRRPVSFVVVSIQHSGTTYLSQQLNRMPGVECGHELLLRNTNPHSNHNYCLNNGKTLIESMEMAWDMKPWVNHPRTRYNTGDGGRNVSSAYDLRSRISCIGKGKFTQKYFGIEWPLSDDEWDFMIKRQYVDSYKTYLSELTAIGFTVQIGQLTFDSDVYQFFTKHDVRVIILERSNFIARMIGSAGVKNQKTPVQQITEDELSHAHAYLQTLNKIKNRTIESCIPTMEVTYEYYLSNYSSFIDIFKFIGLSGNFAAVADLNGTTIKYEYDTGESGSLDFNTESKHHKEVTAHYIGNKKDVLTFIDRNFHGQKCMLLDDCPLEPINVYSDTKMCRGQAI